MSVSSLVAISFNLLSVGASMLPSHDHSRQFIVLTILSKSSVATRPATSRFTFAGGLYFMGDRPAQDAILRTRSRSSDNTERAIDAIRRSLRRIAAHPTKIGRASCRERV